MTNMSLEDILCELAKYGRPHINQYASSATPGSNAGGKWNCDLNIPSEYLPIEKREKFGIPVCGWRMTHTANTPTEAASVVLDKCIALAESDQAAYAKFVSTDMVKGK